MLGVILRIDKWNLNIYIYICIYISVYIIYIYVYLIHVIINELKLANMHMYNLHVHRYLEDVWHVHIAHLWYMHMAAYVCNKGTCRCLNLRSSALGGRWHCWVIVSGDNRQERDIFWNITCELWCEESNYRISMNIPK